MDLNLDEEQFAYKVHAVFLDDDYNSESHSDFDEPYEKYKPPPVELDDFDVVKIDRFSTVCTKAQIKKTLYENRSKIKTLNGTAKQKNSSKSRSKKGKSKGDNQHSKCNEKNSTKSVHKQTNSQNTKSIPPLQKIGCITKQTLSYSQVAKIPKQSTPQIAVVTEVKKEKNKKRNKVSKSSKNLNSQNTPKPPAPKKNTRKTPKLVVSGSKEMPKPPIPLLLVSLEKPLQFDSSTLRSSVHKNNIQPEDVKAPHAVPHKLKGRSNFNNKYGEYEDYPFCDELSKTLKSNELRSEKIVQLIYSDTQNEIKKKITEKINEVPKMQENKEINCQNTPKPSAPKSNAINTPKFVLSTSKEMPEHPNHLRLVSLEKPLQFESSTLRNGVRKNNIQPEIVKPLHTVPYKLKERSDFKNKYSANEDHLFCDDLSKIFVDTLLFVCFGFKKII